MAASTTTPPVATLPPEVRAGSTNEPLRGESFSLEHFEEHARQLAARHVTREGQRGDEELWRRFNENSRILEAAYAAIVQAVESRQTITPGADWLLDNYYVVREQLRGIRDDLPRSYYRELPKLATGALAGTPRVHALALEVITHCDSSLDEEMLTRIVRAYQEVAPLTIGELWAIPIMLRLGLVENLRRLADQLILTLQDQRLADEWMDDIVEGRCDDVMAYLAERTRGMPPLASSMLIRLVQRCHEQGQALGVCWQWLQQRVAAEGDTIDDVIRAEHQRQACNQVSTGNVITSMRLISALDWNTFVERVSLVDEVLREDPAGVYEQMDFATRDRYRHAIERLSRRSAYGEIDVARHAVTMASRSTGGEKSLAVRHVGYYLIGPGQLELERLLRCRPTLAERLARWAVWGSTFFYLSAVGLGTLAVLAILLGLGRLMGEPWPVLCCIALAAFLPASEVAVSVVNFLATKLLAPRVMPKLEFKQGIPDSCATIVVMPVLIYHRHAIVTLVQRMELHYLANPEPNLLFAILADFADAPSQHMPEDDELIDEAKRLIRQLNAKYPRDGVPRFHVFHRQRRWNVSEGKWIAWERKRGKLDEFNEVLRGARHTSFVLDDLAATVSEALRQVKYVITLDADTQLPLGAASSLVGAIAHPLNHEYAIFQPRIEVNWTSSRRTTYSRIISGNPHVDPYVRAVSDVYQDVFGEGSFVGKGIYQVDAFSRAVHDVFPENQILSHDLIEGCHARSALVTDIQLIDDVPTNYHADARRRHRWVRGDWQILPWLFSPVPSRRGWRRNTLSAISRWKIFDNLRRSMVPPALLVYFLVAWFVLPGSAWLWTLFGLLVLAMPLILHCGSIVLGRPRRVPWALYLRQQASDVNYSASQTLLAVSFLVDQAHLMVDAIARALFRMTVTRRHLLEWEAAAATESRFQPVASAFLTSMWSSPTLAILVAVGIAALGDPVAVLSAAPMLALWFAAPLIAYRTSRPRQVERVELSEDEQRGLRDIARRTWLFFETFVTEQGNWLPPDNYQEQPGGIVAYRTSPTNQGMLLASVLGARDLGYVGLHALVDLLEKSLDSWSSLEHFRGHPYNWYDIQTMRPLAPEYVSTVDSGNLAAALLTLAEGLREMIDTPVFGPRVWDGLHDALRIDIQNGQSAQRGANECAETTAAIQQLLSQPAPTSMTDWAAALGELQQRLDGVGGSPERRSGDGAASVAVADSVASESTASDSKPRRAERFPVLARQLSQLQVDLQNLFPWALEPGALECGADGSETATSKQPRLLGTSLERELLAATTLRQLARLGHDVVQPVAEKPDPSPGDQPSAAPARPSLWSAVAAGATAATDLADRMRTLAQRCDAMASAMDFTLLYNPQRRLFSVGYNATIGQLDRAHYDLLASEARLASFLAIGKGDVEHEHWFQLGRPMTSAAGSVCLLSWGGTMFEYLMPSLFVNSDPDTLLEQSCRVVVDRQIEFGDSVRLPWGISESAFSAIDGTGNYQYQSFGVPGLGLKRGLSNDLVVSPYSTALALAVDPRQAIANFDQLTRHGAMGPLGYYEAIDFTPERLVRGAERAVVRCYMAHHQGMTLLSIVNCILDGRMRRRFHAVPSTRATEMLLHERIPIASPLVEPHQHEMAAAREVRETARPITRLITTVDTPSPRAHLLSNSYYSVMITSVGGGYSQGGDLQVTRWRADSVRDDWGQFVFVRDRRGGAVWSAGFQPTRRQPDAYEVLFAVDKAEFRRRDGHIETHMEVAVSPEHNVEVRQITITNHGTAERQLDVTSYAEVVLTKMAADIAHVAFHKLFVQTEFVAEHDSLLATRRPRDADERPVWAFHTLACEHSDASEPVGAAGHGEAPACHTEYETDRARFIGRGRSIANPAAMVSNQPLSRTSGAVLDPIFSLRRPVRLRAGQSVRLAFTTGLAASRDEAVALADQYHDLRVVQRVFELAWAHSQVELQHRQLSPADAQLYQRLASHLIYPDAAFRSPAAVLASNQLGQSHLWRFGVSGDHPIVLVRVNHERQQDLVREMLLAHEYWRSKGLVTELVVLNEHPGGYVDEIQQQLQGLIDVTGAWSQLNTAGGIFILSSGRMSSEDRVLFESVAHVVLHGEEGNLASQLESPAQLSPSPAMLPVTRRKSNSAATKESVAGDPRFWNGRGGFSADGREYVIELEAHQTPPAPWCNVIANPAFGCLVSDAGLGFAWAENSRENKLTSWSNDPVCDPPSEAIYVRDDESGEYWSPTPLPCRDGGKYTIRHGFGYSCYERSVGGVGQSLLVSVAAEDPVKFLRLELTNETTRRRELSVFYCAQLVLGIDRQQSQMHLVTSVDPESGALMATNRYHEEFASRVAFVTVLAADRSLTGDRREFFGRHGSWDDPRALKQTRLSDRTGAGFDPCGAVQARIQLAPGERVEVVFLLGQGSDDEAARACLARYATPGAVRAEIESARSRWARTLGTLQVSTPNPALDIMVNGWLLYQTISSRLWGRTSFYQCSGAYGFRDQLQDVMALVHARPELAREHILRAAQRQFEEGDVQHWWHEPAGRGVRTRCSDDYLWLPHVVSHYLDTTGDESIFDERIPYLRSAVLEPHEHERYETPEVSAETDHLYGHCLRAIDRAVDADRSFGPHRLPIIGSCDWNDGMNRVGIGGRGESVWLAWFLIDVLRRFLPWVERRRDHNRAATYRASLEALREAVEQHGWDGPAGKWYRRAYFDDGTPLGSAANDECQLDSLAQSWAVIAGGDRGRAQTAMQSVLERLVDRDHRLLRLLDPPFDHTTLDPGYIKGYPPGIRENGGQYTHAALWFVQALALLGEREETLPLLDMLNPVTHADSARGREVYAVEPYVVAADVYTNPSHAGRGGWSWYTGSAAWMYRVAVEYVLGIERRGGQLRVNPCVPASWAGFEFTYRVGSATYHVVVDRVVSGSPVRVTCDGRELDGDAIELRDDGQTHEVRVAPRTT